MSRPFSVRQIIDEGYGWVQAAMEGKIFWGTMFDPGLYENFGHLLHHQFRAAAAASSALPCLSAAMLGGAFGYFWPFSRAWLGSQSCLAFVVVGIGGFFAGVAKVPISSIIMAS